MILRSPLRRLAATLVPALALGACTNGKLVVGSLYNRLDDRMMEQFAELGDFEERQRALFEERVGTFHVWHRRTELPAYARLIEDVAASIADPGRTSVEDIERWGERVERRAIAARECHPVNFSFELMRSLEDEQLDQIETTLARKREERRDRYDSRTPEERVERRVRNVGKWSKRIGVELTAAQNAMLRTAFTRQTSLRTEYFALSDRWRAEFFHLAREQESPDYEGRIAAHLDELWSLLESEYPEQWERNRRLWAETGLRLVASLDTEQRATLSAWLAKMGETLGAISRDEPSFVPGSDPSVGCLVGTAASDRATAVSGPAG